MRHLPLLLVASILATQVAFADPTLPSPEKAVLIEVSTGDVVVAWLPPSEGPALTYRVYGYHSGGREPLAETPGLSAIVPDGYSVYAVVALYDGNESPPETAEGCLTIDTNIPPNAIINPAACLS